MINTIMHVIGICPDSLDHFNLASLANIPMTELTHLINSLKLRLWKIKTYLKYKIFSIAR